MELAQQHQELMVELDHLTGQETLRQEPEVAVVETKILELDLEDLAVEEMVELNLVDVLTQLLEQQILVVVAEVDQTILHQINAVQQVDQV